MRRLLFTLSAVMALAVATSANIMAATNYKIDVDTTFGGTSINTEPGWSSLDATLGNASPGVTIDGVTFTVGSADGGRNRTGPNDLTRDFVFDDGAGQAVLLFFGGAGDLQAGTWQVDMYSWDAGADVGNQFAAYRTSGVETIVTSTATADPVNPAASFTFESDGFSAYDVFFRENNAENRTRLNAVELTFLAPPEPPLITIPVLGLDFNEGGNLGANSPPTQTGFQEFALAGASTNSTSISHNYGPIDVTLSSAGAGSFFQARRRTQPTNGGAFDQQELLRDFAFARPADALSGLDVLIEGLDANTEYEVTLWSFDDGSTVARTSDWSANGELKVENYSFNGAVDPSNNDQYSMTFTVDSNGAGEILIEGRPDAQSTNFAVFLDGLSVAEVVPEPSTFVMAILGLLGMALCWKRNQK